MKPKGDWNMAFVIMLLLLFIGCLFKGIDGILTVKQESDHIKSLAPNGYALEYKLAFEKYNYFRAKADAKKKEMGIEKKICTTREEEAEIWNDVEAEIWADTNKYPEVRRALEKHNKHHDDLLYYWASIWARLETVKHGKNPMVIGKVDPQPLPTGVQWALDGGDTPLPGNLWGRTNWFQDKYDGYLKQDQASERELGYIRR